MALISQYLFPQLLQEQNGPCVAWPRGSDWRLVTAGYLIVMLASDDGFLRLFGVGDQRKVGGRYPAQTNQLLRNKFGAVFL